MRLNNWSIAAFVLLMKRSVAEKGARIGGE
jgi:hypothetical protein